MYYPAGPAKTLAVSYHPDDPIITVKPNKRSALFALLRKKSVEIWSIRPSCKLAVVDRTTSSLSKYGENVDLAWTPNSGSFIILTTTSCLLDYDLAAKDSPDQIHTGIQANSAGNTPTPIAVSTLSSQLHPPIPNEHITTFPPSAGEGHITPYNPPTQTSNTLDSALDDVQASNDGPGKDGLFRYSYSSVGFGLEVTFKGIAKVGRGLAVVSGGIGFLDGGFGASRLPELMIVLESQNSAGPNQIAESEINRSEHGKTQQIVAISYPLKPEHLLLDPTDLPANLPSNIQSPTQTSTSITGMGTSTRFGATFLSALSAQGRRAEDKTEAGMKEWVALSEDVELNVDVRKWDVAEHLGLGGKQAISTFEFTRSNNSFLITTIEQSVFLGRHNRSAHARESGNLIDHDETFAREWTCVKLCSPIEHQADKVEALSINPRFGLCAIGMQCGKVVVVRIPGVNQEAETMWRIVPEADSSSSSQKGSIKTLTWTTDGYGLAVGWDHSMGIWNSSGDCDFAKPISRSGSPASIYEAEPLEVQETSNKDDSFLDGAQCMVWTTGNNELLVLTPDHELAPSQVVLVPMLRNSATAQQDPTNPSRPIMLLDDSVRIYRGADRQADAVLDPEADLWDDIKVPPLYVATQWPLRQAAISTDGLLLAVAGHHGLMHYSFTTGRWKLFADEEEEAAFSVKGGMIWYFHVLIVATETKQGHEIRLYSRDQDLSEAKSLDRQRLPHSIVTMSLQDSALLVLTSDNTLYHYAISPTRDSIKLSLCNSISLQGLLPTTSRIRCLSWFVPALQRQIGDSADDLLMANIVILAGSDLILLESKKSAHGGVKLEARLLEVAVESFFVYDGHVKGLHRSLWAFSKRGLVLWLDVVKTLTPVRITTEGHPLAVLHSRGIVVSSVCGVETRRNTPFVDIRMNTIAELYASSLLEELLSTGKMVNALEFARTISQLPYFGYTLEVLLRTAMEGKIDEFIVQVVNLLDHFPQALTVPISYARKTEEGEWTRLFQAVGEPKDLFDRCLARVPPDLSTASQYLLAIKHHEHNGFDILADTSRLLALAVQEGSVQLSEDIIRFLHSVDPSGELAETVLASISGGIA